MKFRILLIMILFVAVNTGIADINMATPIRQGVHIEWYRTVCPGGDGSAIYTSQKYRWH